VEDIYRVGSAPRTIRNRLTGFEKAAFPTERLLSSELRPLAPLRISSAVDEAGSALLRPTRLLDGFLGTGRIMDGILGTTRLMDGILRPYRMFGGILGGFHTHSRGRPDLSMIDPTDRPAWTSAHMDLLYHSTHSGPYGRPRPFAAAARAAGLTVVHVLSRAGPTPTELWMSAMGAAHRAAVFRFLSLGRSLPSLAVALLRKAWARVSRPLANLWASHALRTRPNVSVALLGLPRRGAGPSRLVRAEPAKSHAPPRSFNYRGRVAREVLVAA
jgi:hypothetical protein